MTEEQFVAKPARPRWANALIIAAVLFGAGVIFTFTSGAIAPWFFGAAVLTALVGGILALMKTGA